MAKKTASTKATVISVADNNIINNENGSITSIYSSLKKSLKEMTISELIDYEKAARTICIKYEKSAASWGIDTVRGDYAGMNEFQQYYTKYKNIYDKIIDEIEKRLDNIIL